jgi:hypothetical protein
MDKEETTTIPPVEPQAGETDKSSQPQAGENTTPEPQAGDGTSTEAMSPEEAKKLRSESANLRKRLKDAEASKSELAELKKFKEQKDAETLSENEKKDLEKKKLEQQVAEKEAALEKALQQVRDSNISRAVLEQAAKMNIVDPGAAILFIKADVELDDSDNPTNIPDLLKALVKEKPYLVQQTRQISTAGGATNASRSQTSGGQLSHELIGKMSKEEYAGRRLEINQWMAQNTPR